LLTPFELLTEAQPIFSLQISITVPGCLHGRVTQERQEEEEGPAHTVVFEKEEGEEEGRGLS